MLPPMYGLEAAGTSSTTATHQNEDTRTVTAAMARPTMRLRSPPRAATRYVSPNAGSTR